MPQIQVLPAVPTFGGDLVRTLAQGISTVAEGYQKKRDRTKLENLLKDISNPNSSAAPAAAPIASPENQNQQNQPAPNQIPQQAQQPSKPQINPIKYTQLYDSALPVLGKDGAKLLADSYMKKDIAAEKEFNTERRDLRKIETKEEEKLDEFQAPIVAKKEAAEISKSNLDSMERLIDSDKLISPLGAYLTNLFGAPVSLTSGPESEEFRKLAAQRGLNVASAYGFGRILETEFNNFLNTIPDLLNSKEGKKRIVNTLRYADNLANARYDEYRKLLSERKPGDKVRNLQLKLEDRMKPYYDKFGEVLKYGDQLVELRDENGKLGKVPKNQLQEALDFGYTLPGQE